MHIMPGAVKIERRSSGKSSTAPGLGTDPLDLLPIDEARHGSPVENPTLADAWITTCMLPSHHIEGGINEASAISGMPSWHQEITLGSFFFHPWKKVVRRRAAEPGGSNHIHKQEGFA